MIKKVLKTLQEFKMLSKNKPLIVGLSGGADSVCLAHILKNIFTENELIAAHVNYGLRGKESERDENFVRDFCEKLDIKLYVEKADIKDFSEEKGRKLRYSFFGNLAEKFNAKISTAHTLSDNCETILLNLTRGTALRGLCGIPPVRGNIIRPLIFITREEVENYILDNKLNFVTDSSNFSNIFSRNKIRNSVIPILKEINPNFENAIQKLILNTTVEEQFLNEIAEKEFENSKISDGFNTKTLKNLPKNLKFRVSAKILKFFSPKKQEEQIHIQKIVEIINNKIKATEVPGKVKIFRKDNILRASNI